MKKLILSFAVVLILSSCGKKEEPLPPLAPAYIIENLESIPYFADTLLPQELSKYQLTLNSSLKTIKPKELLQSQPAQAEKYLNHLFVGMTSGSYTFKDNSLTAEIIQFGDEIHAYGYYSLMRQNGIVIEKIGAESFVLGNSRYMVKGDYVVVASIENLTDKASDILRDFCIEIDNDILGSKATPPFFLLFPYKDKIIPSNKYYPYQFLEIPGFNEVYTTSYLIGADTVTLFLTMDVFGDKLKYLKQFAQQSGNVVESFNRFAFDSSLSIAFKYDPNGVIVGGRKSQKLVGTIKYNPKASDKLVTTWIKGL